MAGAIRLGALLVDSVVGLKVHRERRLAVFMFCGTMTASTGRRAFVDYVASADFDPAHVIFWDIRRAEVVTDFTGIFGAVQSLSPAFARFPQEVAAVMLVRGALQFGMARMLQQIVEFAAPIRIEIVETEAEACARLGVAPEDLAGLLPEPQME